MTKTLSMLSALVVLAGPAGAEGPIQASLASAAAISHEAAMSGSLDAAKYRSGVAMGDDKGAVPVQEKTDKDHANSPRPTGDLANTGGEKGFKPKEPPPPGEGGILKKTGDAIKGVGEKLKPYVPHALAGGLGMAAGGAIAAVAGAGILGGVLTGGALGVAAYMLHEKGQTHTAIGALSFGVAGLALGGPVGGIIGALAGGVGAWLIGKFINM